MGVLLAFPSRFALGDRRLRGLGTGGFYVEPGAHMQGFFMFRRLLKTRGVDFVFSTSCNATSAQLWEKLGGRPIPAGYETFSVLLPPGPSPTNMPSGAALAACWPPRRVSPGAWPRRSWPSGAARAKIDFLRAPTGTGWPISRPGTATRMPSPASVPPNISAGLPMSPAPRGSGGPVRGPSWPGRLVRRSGPAGRRAEQDQELLHPRSHLPAAGPDLAALLHAIAAVCRPGLIPILSPRDRSRAAASAKLWRRRTPFATSYLIDPGVHGRPLAEAAGLVPADGDRFP